MRNVYPRSLRSRFGYGNRRVASNRYSFKNKVFTALRNPRVSYGRKQSYPQRFAAKKCRSMVKKATPYVVKAVGDLNGQPTFVHQPKKGYVQVVDNKTHRVSYRRANAVAAIAKWYLVDPSNRMYFTNSAEIGALVQATVAALSATGNVDDAAPGA